MMRPGNFPLKLLFDSSGLRPTLGYYDVAETVEANPPSKRELGLALHLKMTNTDDGEIEQVEDFVWFDPTTGLPAEILKRLNRTQDPQGGRSSSHPGFVPGEIQSLTDEIKYVKDGQTWQVESWRTTTSGIVDRKSFAWRTRIHRLDVAAVPARLFEDALALSEKPGAELPERAGEITYDAARTICTMPVKLQPGKVYWVGVNGPQHRNFKSPDGTPARPYQILFATRSADGKSTPLPEELVKQAREINAARQPTSHPATSSAKGNDSVVVKELALSVLRAIKEDDLATLKSLSAGSRQGWLEVDWMTPYQQGKIKFAGEPPVGWSQGDLKQGAAEIRRDVLSRNPDAATKVLQTLVQDDWAATLSPVTASQYLVMVFVKTDGGWRFATFDQSKGNLADDLAKHMANIPANLKVLRQLDHSSASQTATSTSSGPAAGSNRGETMSQPSTSPATGPAIQLAP